MIGLVIVSHSAKLAEGVCDLARQVAQGKVRIAAAGGTADPENPIGTDAFQVLQAIESVYSEDGVLVLMDLGSAVLSAETALELLGERAKLARASCAPLRWWKEPWRQPAWPPPAPALAEIALRGAKRAAGRPSVRRRNRLRHHDNAALQRWGRRFRLRALSSPQRRCPARALVTLTNRLGLHARPAAQLVRLARRYRAQVTHRQRRRPASINAVLSLGARQGHQLRICAQGAEAREALAALVDFIESGCGELSRLCGTAMLSTRPAASRRPRASPSVRWSNCAPPPWKSPRAPSGIPRRSGNA